MSEVQFEVRRAQEQREYGAAVTRRDVMRVAGRWVAGLAAMAVAGCGGSLLEPEEPCPGKGKLRLVEGGAGGGAAGDSAASGALLVRRQDFGRLADVQALVRECSKLPTPSAFRFMWGNGGGWTSEVFGLARLLDAYEAPCVEVDGGGVLEAVRGGELGINWDGSPIQVPAELGEVGAGEKAADQLGEVAKRLATACDGSGEWLPTGRGHGVFRVVPCDPPSSSHFTGSLARVMGFNGVVMDARGLAEYHLDNVVNALNVALGDAPAEVVYDFEGLGWLEVRSTRPMQPGFVGLPHMFNSPNAWSATGLNVVNSQTQDVVGGDPHEELCWRQARRAG